MSYLFQNSQHRQMIENLNIHHHNMAVEKAAADVRRRRKERRIEIRLKELTKGSSAKLLWSEGKRGRGNLPPLHRMEKPKLEENDRDRALRMITARAEDKLQRRTLRDRRALIQQWSQQKKATTPGPETASTTLQEEKPPLRPHSTAPLLVRPGKDVLIDRIMPSGKTLRSQWGVAPKTTFSSRAIVTEVTLGSGPHVEAFSP